MANISYIGADEVGVGDYFGGLVTCAAFVSADQEQELKLMGVRDSKQLTDAEMKEIFNKIKNIVKFKCLVYTPEKYNAAVKKYKNTHIVKSIMHNTCIEALSKEIKAPVVLDQYVEAKNYYAYFDKIGVRPHKVDIFATKAENKYVSVAVASIIARVAFVKQMEELRKSCEINFPFGASDPRIVDFAKQIYNKGGLKELDKYVKVDFKTTQKVIGNGI